MKIYSRKFKKNAQDPFQIQLNNFDDAKLSAGYRMQWTEEGIMGQREAEIPGNKIGRNISMQKIAWLSIFLLVGFFSLSAKTAYLQIAQGDQFQGLSQNNRIRQERIVADRGVITDADYNVLSHNTPLFYLEVIPADVINNFGENDFNQLGGDVIGEILGQDVSEALDYILIKNKEITLESYRPQIFAENIGYDQAVELIIKTKDLPGINLRIKPQRSYNLSTLSFSHLLGYTGVVTKEEYENKKDIYSPVDYVGKTGIEMTWDEYLRGSNGYKNIEVDALGKQKRIINQVDKVDGKNLVLAINSELQVKIEQELIEQLEKVGAKSAAAVALNPQNGEVLALVSFPSYNSNYFALGISQEDYSQLINDESLPLFNRAISAAFPTGSTFKPVIAAAALQEGVVTKDTKFNSVGGIGVKSWFFPDWKAGGHGITDMRKALAWSVNTYFYYIGGGHDSTEGQGIDFDGLGVNKITDYARLFGLGEKLGIDLPNEASGFLPSKQWKLDVKGENWYIGDTYNISIGQGDILATPLQVAAFTSFYANQGTLYRPHLVKELLNNDNTKYAVVEPEVIRHNFIDAQHIQTIREGMRDAVVYGSASSMKIVPVPVAGKTGTAQWSNTKKPHSWFTGFAPYEDAQIVITVIVEEGGEASDAAVPVARRVLEWWFGEKNNDGE
ncbi:MAG: penicillin-binding protein 2 [bacterium]|nr:penicillin-binding protein 2 [bacterium]